MAYTPKLLDDKSRLKEIYDLRVNVWQNSGNPDVVNKHIFPNGWYDDLDDKAHHWIVTNEEDKIIAAARLNIFENIEEFPYYESIKNLDIPKEGPFGFYSRLVIDPKYQGMKLSLKLVTSRLLFCETIKLKWLQAHVSKEVMMNVLSRYDFEVVGQIQVNYHKSTDPHEVNVFVRDFSKNRDKK